MSVSRDARLFFVGLWNQCDDKGVFEWKPVGLRMRILPADQIDVEPLLEELAGANLIRRYEVDGRRYGVVRNFAIYQRPKKPNNLFPLPPEFKHFSGLNGAGSPLVRNQFTRERKEGVGEGKEVPPKAPPRSLRTGKKDAAFTTVLKRQAQ